MIKRIRKILKKIFAKRWSAYEDEITIELVVPLCDNETMEKLKREIQEHIGVYK